MLDFQKEAADLEYRACLTCKPHPSKLVNETYACLQCWHYRYFRFLNLDKSLSFLVCCACGEVWYPQTTSDDSIHFAMGTALD